MAGQDMLVVAPYIGEFGWELMNWQGRIRRLALSSRYGHVVVCAQPDRHPLYMDHEGEGRVLFCPVSAFDVPGSGNEDHRVDERHQPIPARQLRDIVIRQTRESCRPYGIDTSDAEILTPPFTSTIWPTTRNHQVFRNLRISTDITIDILLVPRFRGLAAERNRPREWWESLAGRLEGRGLRVGIYEPHVDRAIIQLSSARLAIGASTGGMHLASLCACPHYVWGCGSECRWTRMEITNRQRYETMWNPLGTRCRYDECGWQPSEDHVVERSLAALDEIGLRDGEWSGVRRVVGGLLAAPRWRMKRGLARLITAESSESNWPWCVRSLVRQHLV